MNALLDPFRFGFMLEAFAMGALLGAVAAVLSCFLVLRGWSLMGDAVSHAVLPGIVLASMSGLPLAVGAFVSGLFCAVASGWIKAHTRLKEDTAMGVAFTGLFALGLVLMSKHVSDLHLDHVLFGNILGIPRPQLIEATVLSVLVLAAVLMLRRDLLLVAFDPAQARALGRPVAALNYTLLTLLSLSIVTSMQLVGLLLVIAMLITPGATAFLLARRFDEMLLKAVLSAVGSALVGIYVSFFLNGSPAACIVLVQALVFVGALLFAPGKGLLRRA
ncbi:MAG: metal ABC transporter permease [Verrucomicrobia bacterium]|nr:metal ABC transporter permease [Verrucomicrobiota bacterium]